MQSIEVDQPFHRDGWTYEEKYDGWRMIAYKDGRHVQLISRAGKDHSHRFADLAAAIRTLPSGTRIGLTEAEVAKVERLVRETVSKGDLGMIVSNIGSTPDFSASAVMIGMSSWPPFAP